MQAAKLNVLDDASAVERLDAQGLLGRIEGLPEQCEEAWRRASEWSWPDGLSAARGVVVLGMGGSAIAGEILRSIASVSGRKNVTVVRGYDLPPFVGGETLAVACSHSGNTEETLSAFEQALSSGARCVVVTTGGALRERAEERGVPAFVYEYEGEPRSALGHQLMALLAVGERSGALELQRQAVHEAAGLLREQRERLGFDAPANQNLAKQIAGRLAGRLPVVVGARPLAVAAYRWKTQLNENSKCWAIAEELPELDHNTVVGFGLPEQAAKLAHVVFLSHEALHPRLLLRYDATAEALAEAGVSHEQVEVGGTSALAQILSAVFLGDLVSYYLALLNGVEPAPVVVLERLKARLAGR